MRGLITEREVFRNLPLIWREFGFRCFIRCVRALLSSQPTTFLEVVANPTRRSSSPLPENLTDRSALLPFFHERSELPDA
jgi:hypothetical protein